jgi:hypothetical protein
MKLIKFFAIIIATSIAINVNAQTVVADTPPKGIPADTPLDSILYGQARANATDEQVMKAKEKFAEIKYEKEMAEWNAKMKIYEAEKAKNYKPSPEEIKALKERAERLEKEKQAEQAKIKASNKANNKTVEPNGPSVQEQVNKIVNKTFIITELPMASIIQDDKIRVHLSNDGNMIFASKDGMINANYRIQNEHFFINYERTPGTETPPVLEELIQQLPAVFALRSSKNEYSLFNDRNELVAKMDYSYDGFKK